MDIKELITKPIKVIMENNISDDVVKAEDSFKKIKNMLDDAENPADFFIAYVDSQNLLKAAITSKELRNVVDAAQKISQQEGGPIENIKLSDLNLEAIAPPNLTLKSNDEVRRALDMFSSGEALVIPVIDDAGRYIGKIKLQNFVERIKLLTS